MEANPTSFQDLQWVIDRATIQFNKNKKSSMSALFRKCRKNPNFSLFGDYFLLWAIAEAKKRLNLPVKRNDIWYAAKQSKEYKEITGTEKRWWLNSLTGNK